MDGYKVRKAVSEDKDDILRIHDNVYSGLDYLPDYFDDFMEDPLITSYVYEEFGEIIGYLATHHVDNGKTSIDRAGRVNPRYIGTGVYRKLLAGVEDINRQMGIVKRHAMVKIEPPSGSFRKIYKHIMTRTIQTYEFRCSDVKFGSQITRSDGMYRLESFGDRVPSMYMKNNFVDYLFPEKRMLIDWVPLRPIENNIPIMKGKQTMYFADACATSARIHTGLLTASSIYRPHHGVDVSCTVDVFGSDFRTLNRHIAFHLNRIYSFQSESVNLAVISSGKTDSAAIDNCLRTFGIGRLGSGSRSRNHPQIYEKWL